LQEIDMDLQPTTANEKEDGFGGRLDLGATSPSKR
jgi:hypothetical protein